MRTTKTYIFLVLTLFALPAAAQTDQAFNSANCNASFLVDCASTDTSTDTSSDGTTTTSSAFTVGGSAAPAGQLGGSPVEIALLMLLGVGAVRAARKVAKSRDN